MWRKVYHPKKKSLSRSLLLPYRSSSIALFMRGTLPFFLKVRYCAVCCAVLCCAVLCYAMLRYAVSFIIVSIYFILLFWCVMLNCIEFNTKWHYAVTGVRASNQPSLMNVMMELRKCCNHPYLLRWFHNITLCYTTIHNITLHYTSVTMNWCDVVTMHMKAWILNIGNITVQYWHFTLWWCQYGAVSDEVSS